MSAQGPWPSATNTPGSPSTRGRRVQLWVPLAILAVIVVGIPTLFFALRTCACTASPSVPPTPIVGVVVRVDSEGLGQVHGFDLRLEDGSTVTLTLGPLDNAAEFSPSHLTEHQASSEPVRAFYRLEAGIPVVYRLEDAPRA